MVRLSSKIRTFFYHLLLKEQSPQKLTLSCCVGIYIAFSPWIFFHTAMIFILSWLLQLNPAATFMSTYIINNPWTMAPLYFVDYIFGNWFLYICFGLNSMTINPSWIEQANTWIAYYTGFKGISFWGFMVGGNLLGILFSVILYPVLLNIFTKMLKTANSQLYQHENNSQEQKSVP